MGWRSCCTLWRLSFPLKAFHRLPFAQHYSHCEEYLYLYPFRVIYTRLQWASPNCHTLPRDLTLPWMCAITLHIVIVRVIDAAKLTRERSYSCPNPSEEGTFSNLQSAAERFGAAKRAIGAGRVSLALVWVP